MTILAIRLRRTLPAGHRFLGGGKSEMRSTKSETSPKHKTPMSQGAPMLRARAALYSMPALSRACTFLGHSGLFGISDFDIRASAMCPSQQHRNGHAPPKTPAQINSPDGGLCHANSLRPGSEPHPQTEAVLAIEALSCAKRPPLGRLPPTQLHPGRTETQHTQQRRTRNRNRLHGAVENRMVQPDVARAQLVPHTHGHGNAAIGI